MCTCIISDGLSIAMLSIVAATGFIILAARWLLSYLEPTGKKGD